MSTTPQTRALKPVEELRMNLEKMGPQFKAALPSHVSPEKFIRVAQTTITSNPALLKADRVSLFAALVKCSQVGLVPDGRESALVPFGTTVQFMPMIGGILKLARQSGELSTIMAEIVYEKDVFRYWIDSEGQHLNHEPKMFGDRGKPIGVYALAKLKDNALYVEMLSETQVMSVKNVSRSKDSGPWAGAFALEMWKKTAIRRLAKRLPLSTDLDQAFKYDDENNSFEPEAEVKTEKPAKKSRLKNLLETAQTNTAEPEVTEEPEVVVESDTQSPI